MRLCVVAAGPVAGCGSGPWGVSHASHTGAAEGTEDFVHKGRVCRLGFPLSADGGLQFRPAPAPGSGGSRCSITPPWSSARLWAPRVWLAALPGPSRIHYAGEEARVGWWVRVWRFPVSLWQAGRGGPGSAAHARGMREEVIEVLFVSDTMGC